MSLNFAMGDPAVVGKADPSFPASSSPALLAEEVSDCSSSSFEMFRQCDF